MLSLRFITLTVILAIPLICLRPHQAHAQINLTWGGRFQTDVRGRVNHARVGDWTHGAALERGIVFNRNMYKMKLNADTGDASGVVNIDFLWFGFTDEIKHLTDLTWRKRIDPYELKAHALYVEVHDLFITGLDLRVGQQVVNWGKGDQFNPTNNLNANDYEDPLLFGEQLANTMLRADFSPTGQWSLSAVLVPVFKPSLLPSTAPMELLDTGHIPIEQNSVRRRLYTERAVARKLGQLTTIISDAQPDLPALRFENMQYAIRFAGSIFNQDVALSYYVGRSDTPQPYRNFATQVADARCNPADPTDCIVGAIATTAQLHYPQMEVLGLNVAGEIDLSFIDDDARGLGYHVELGVFLPHLSTLRIFSSELDTGIAGQVQPAGEYNYDLGGQFPTVIDEVPFAKWNIGFDYSFGSNIYVNAQWVHGFPDEFGAGDFLRPGLMSVRGYTLPGIDLSGCYLSSGGEQCVGELMRPHLGDYLVMGADVKFFDERLLTRLFVIYDLTGMTRSVWDDSLEQRVNTYYSAFSGEGLSAILFPEVTYVAGGLELSVGGLIALGEDYTKFGSPAIGGSLVWTRARYNF